MAKTAGTRYPFRFYGVAPGDWLEGANMGHAYELHFVSAPDAATRDAIASAFEGAIYGSAVVARSPWSWSGAWATFFVGDGPTAKTSRDAFAAMKPACKAIHAVAALEEVVFHGALHESADAWERWSISRRPFPTAAPKWPGLDYTLGLFGAAQERFAPTEAPHDDAAFEAARARARETLLAAAATTERSRAVARSRPALVPVESPPPSGISQEDCARLPSAPRLVGGTAFATRSTSAALSLCWLDGPERRELEIPFCTGVGIHHDATRAVFVSRRILSEVVLGTKAVTALRDLGADPGFAGWPAVGCGYGVDDTIVVLSNTRLVLFAREPEGLREIAALPIVKGGSVQMHRGGTIALCTTYSSRVVVFAVGRGGLKQLASIATADGWSYGVGDRIFVGSGATKLELVNCGVGSRPLD